MNEYPSFIVFNFDLVHGMIFLCEILPYNLSISCRFKVQLIFEGAKFLKGNQYLDSWVPLPDYFEVIRYYRHARKAKNISKLKKTSYSIYRVLALSHKCKCVSTKISSITEERLSRNRRIRSILLTDINSKRKEPANISNR